MVVMALDGVSRVSRCSMNNRGRVRRANWRRCQEKRLRTVFSQLFRRAFKANLLHATPGEFVREGRRGWDGTSLQLRRAPGEPAGRRGRAFRGRSGAVGM